MTPYDLLDEPLGYKTYGSKYIETLAKQQMNLAMRLPITLAGALMPDAHAGYGLPIGEYWLQIMRLSRMLWGLISVVG